MDKRTVCISIDTDDPAIMAKVSELFARTLAGLAMDGVYGNVYIYDPTEDLEDDEKDDE